ncbi:MAG: site-specific DNA-methyltransferase [Planctomycetes bacterium]|nr:site-specific DNA-methyltransferase [Planctomycetota bacterium]NUQ34741.1 site-specific DNA-methyltransferase [Planctomycetaceae bacterium]
MGRLIAGDALDVCRGLAPACCDFIYCDPPFFTGVKRVNAHHGRHAFDDRWDSIEQFIDWLEARVQVMRALLRPTGIFALHLDWHAVHYAKVMCDGVFGYERFINEIIWCFRTGGASKRTLARKHDTILVYGKSAGHAFYPQKEKSYLSHHYGFSNVEIHTDERGPYREALMRDVWDIPAIRGNQPEATGYPTQKPMALVERLLQCFTKEGDTVGDFFSGSGTTAVVAERMGRNFICGDVSLDALELAQSRTKTQPVIEAADERSQL